MIFSLDVGGRLTEMSAPQIIWKIYPGTQIPRQEMQQELSWGFKHRFLLQDIIAKVHPKETELKPTG